MSDISRRLKKVEKALNVDGELRIVEIVAFHDGEILPERNFGNMTVRYIRYADICKKKDRL